MKPSNNDDPYCRFKNDSERRRALRVREICRFGCYTSLAAAIAICAIWGAPVSSIATLLRLFLKY
jgi:hypothetical protein